MPDPTLSRNTAGPSLPALIAPAGDRAALSIHDLLNGAFQMFGGVYEDVQPYDRPDQRLHLLFFRRLTELQCDYCRALLILFGADQFRAAVPILRALFEVSVAQVLLHEETKVENPGDRTAGRIEECYVEVLNLLKGERVRTNNALRKIKWPAPPGDIYDQLSKLAHVTTSAAFLERAVDFESEPLKSLVARKDIAGVANVILRTGAREDDGARKERWVFVALNTFDLAISSLFALYGGRAPECQWWPCKCISQFEDLAEDYPGVKRNLLWFRLPWQHSKYSEAERLLDDSLNAESGEADEAAPS